MKTYSIEIRIQGSTRQYITIQAPDALTAINNVSEIDRQRCYEYIAREVLLFDFQEDLISYELQMKRSLPILF